MTPYTAHANTMWLCTHRCKEAADIYSYGVVLWEIITQETPQRGNLRDIEVSFECCACFACFASRCAINMMLLFWWSDLLNIDDMVYSLCRHDS